MANWTTLKGAIADVIKANGNQEITGQVLQNVLNNIVSSVGENATFAGVATPATNPGTPDGPVFYIPIRTGAYPNFGGLEHDAEGQIAIFITNDGGSSWKKEIISDLYTHAFFNANIYKYGKKAYDKSLTLAQAIQAGKEAGINDVAKGICFFDGAETKLAFFNNKSYTSGWDNEKNWFVISESVFNKITGNIDVITSNIDVITSNIDDILSVLKTISKEDYIKESISNIPGYYKAVDGSLFEANGTGYFASQKFDVMPGSVIKLKTLVTSSTVASYVFYKRDNSVDIDNIGGQSLDYEYKDVLIPDDVYHVAFSCANYKELIVEIPRLSRNVYTKEEVDEKIIKEGIYGIKWETNNENDLGQRCFDAIGLTAIAGIGNTDGYSDFDNIYPWSEMKRCNIKTNSSGAKIVTFEGEEGFTLDGSNGDVFVRIPKFYSDRYRKDGYDYRTVSYRGTNVHPAFIEDGKELDEIFVAAFEGHVKGNLPEYLGTQLDDYMDAKLFSIGSTEQQRIIPTPNYTLEQYLKFATDKGLGYTLYDMRTMDAIWTLFAVEYGCRNTNRKIAYGYCDLRQPIAGTNNLEITSSTPTNTIIIPNGSATLANRLYVGSSITICKGEQTNVIALRKITENTFDENTKNITITFDGEPVSFMQGETDYFAGSGAASSNLCETLPSDVKLNWHTGRTNVMQVGLNADMINPCRYRWIENPMGSLWHFFPDICFKQGQMYKCDNIRNYKVIFSDVNQLEGYYPVGEPFEATPDTGTSEGQNGNKSDEPGNPNPFVITLDNDVFAKDVSIGRTYKQGITSKQSFGAYYYMFNSESQLNLYYIANGGGFDHTWRSNMLTNRAWLTSTSRWYLYGARLIYKKIEK